MTDTHPIDDLPPVVDLRILGACDLRCPFCFGPRHELGPIELEALLEVVRQLPSRGVRSIVVTGGEPSLLRGLPRLLRTARELGLKTVLSTNGLRFLERMDEIAPHLDWVGLPLDGDSPEANGVMRVGNPRHWNAVLEVLPRLRREHPSVRIKLGTVVCALNRDHVVGIPRILPAGGLPDVWKLYPVVYSGYGADNREQLEFSETDFEPLYQQALAEAARRAIPVVRYDRSKRNGAYLFLEPTGQAVVVREDQERVIGNFVQDFDGVVREWRAYADLEALRANFQATYPD